MTALRALIVDDNAMNVMLAQEVLGLGGFEVESAVDAQQTRDRVISFRPDVVLMDIQMPGVDGLTLTHEIKANPSTRHIVVIAFTAFAMQGDDEKMRASGCDGYLSKPIDVHQFAAQVRACVANARSSGDAG
jgi:CheY-like chemotaxis protein